MNEHTPLTELPELTDERVAKIENGVFAEISEQKASARRTLTSARTRRRRWLTGLGVAAAFAAGVLIAPPILNAVGGPSGVMSASDSAPLIGMSASDGSPLSGIAESAPDMSAADTTVAEDSSSREIIQTAHAALRVADIDDAAASIATLAEEHSGYVETTDLRAAAPILDGASTQPLDGAGYGWISIRVPSADLPEIIDELSASGTVLSSSLSKQDVTSTAIDLRARIETASASVQRLTELMASTTSVGELIEAESALSQRQAELESYEQQLAALDDQVAMSTLQVELTPAATVKPADPAGFGDGLLAGWNGLVVSLNALVITFGFLLPWLAVAGVVVLIIWMIRRRRNRRTTTDAP
jgi:hypothetical protein